MVEVWADHSVSTLSQASRVKCPMAYGGEDDDGHHKRLFNENLGLCTVSPCNSSLLCPKLPTRLCSIFFTHSLHIMRVPDFDLRQKMSSYRGSGVLSLGLRALGFWVFGGFGSWGFGFRPPIS